MKNPGASFINLRKCKSGGATTAVQGFSRLAQGQNSHDEKNGK